jgi:B-cell receptor-associated protein 31
MSRLLRLVYISMATNLRLDKSLIAMKKQAENASSGYKSLLEENESVKKQTAKLHELLDGADGDTDAEKKKQKLDVLTKLMEENAALSAKVEVTGKELQHAEAKVEAVKKQAEGQSSAFMKLLDEKTEADKHAATIKELKEQVTRQEEQLKALAEERDSLRSQIQDYDFMFAEAKKKAE